MTKAQMKLALITESSARLVQFIHSRMGTASDKQVAREILKERKVKRTAAAQEAR